MIVRYVLLNFRQDKISAAEYTLWFWMLTMILEEVFEFFSEHSRGISKFIILIIIIIFLAGYFSQVTNKIDFGIIVILSSCFIFSSFFNNKK